MLQLIKEERKEKEEGRRKWKVVQGVMPGLASPDLAGSHRRPTVSPRWISLGLAGDPQFVFVFVFIFIFFFGPWVSQTHGLFFFFFFFFSGHGFRMIKC
jgi:hypothetical protein